MRLRGRLASLTCAAAASAQLACVGPDITLASFAVGSLSGGVFALTEGRVAVALGLTALGVGLGVAFFFVSDGLAAAAPPLDRTEVARALARGSGPVVVDLGADLALSQAELVHLGQVLRASRQRLSEAMPTSVAPREDWLPFFVALRDVLASEPTLAPRLEALHARQARARRP